MLLLNVMFIVADRGATFNESGCAVALTLFQYCLLVAFVWIGIQVHNLYHMTSTIFISFERRFMLKRCLLGWGKPRDSRLYLIVASSWLRGFRMVKLLENMIISSPILEIVHFLSMASHRTPAWTDVHYEFVLGFAYILFRSHSKAIYSDTPNTILF